MFPYRACVNERWFLNLPGFHGGAYVVAYVEDTRERDLMVNVNCDEDCSRCPYNFEPRMILEIADCAGPRRCAAHPIAPLRFPARGCVRAAPVDRAAVSRRRQSRHRRRAMPGDCFAPRGVEWLVAITLGTRL